MGSPYVILNAAMTADGKISTRGGDSRISCEEDLDRLHRLRSEADAVMVGIGTVLEDDPNLTVRRVKGENPTRIVVDSRARTSSEAKILNKEASTIVAVSNRAEEREVNRLRSLGAQIIAAGDVRVDLVHLLEQLHEREIRKLLLEGGSTLNWSMLREGLVDELLIAVAPRIVGGKGAKTLVGGEGFKKVSEGIKLKLMRYETVGEDLLLIYKVKGSARDSENK
ncbi:5-amino-6-(5-phosphoribosylamino)uracil reductase [candidate division MSBL1 archaeon SCGC-AAA385D11]|uniref:2,5-diamino-6-(ribosylamino)-4(3H)-pyrimidinone 5'-phosphate reductase n=1 Tax=candidate division MSBL1 archaeon SCGC-AAA385D11 TaxID=1698286 RepID=A0A133VNB8_9EURY|nr:5-amino-6-(5-phosphoribosylamino)uracil reductase [candidate division MSBL1 archaeon SCGC-AAA385D11]